MVNRYVEENPKNPELAAGPLPSRSNQPVQGSPVWRWIGRLFRLCLLVAIVGAGAGVSHHWLANPPATQRRPPKPESIRVEVMPITLGPQPIIVSAMGTVVPAHEIQIAARVSGQIVGVSPQFEPGGQFEAGEMLVKIEREDYELLVQQQAGNLTKVQSEVKLEMGQQAVAQREYEILGEGASDEDEELLLRQPQLAAKRASVSVAEAMFDKARLDLERTEVAAPFNALVQTRLVDLGSYIAPGAPLAKLIGTDEFWIEVSVPVDELEWIDIPATDSEGGSEARVYNEAAWGAEVYREGRVVRLLADLEPQGRMARLLVAVQDPLELHSDRETRRPLLLGSFVRVEIAGKELVHVANIPRTALRDGSRVWVMTGDHILDIREAEVVWSSPDRVYIGRGLSDGDALVISDLPAPVQGMALRTGEASSPGSDRPPANKPGPPA